MVSFRQPFSRWIAAVALPGLLALNAHAATITATSDKSEVNFGEQFTVTLTLSNYNGADPEVDAIEFRVDFDSSLFSFVSGAAETGGGEWLADNQGGGYSPLDDSDDTFVGFGRWVFGVGDDGETPAGSRRANPGALGSLTLEAGNTQGTGSVTPNATNDSLVFFDTDDFGITVTGGLTFVSDSVTIVPEPASAGLLAAACAGTWMMGLRRSPQQKA